MSFDRERAIVTWRQELLEREELEPRDVDELEGHLREAISVLVREGLVEGEAFRVAAERLGTSEAIAGEYAKVNLQRIWTRRVVLMLAGYLILWTVRVSLPQMVLVAAYLSRTAGYLAWLSPLLLIALVGISGDVVGLAAIVALGRRSGTGRRTWRAIGALMLESRGRIATVLIATSITLYFCVYFGLPALQQLGAEGQRAMWSNAGYHTRAPQVLWWSQAIWPLLFLVGVAAISVRRNLTRSVRWMLGGVLLIQAVLAGVSVVQDAAGRLAATSLSLRNGKLIALAWLVQIASLVLVSLVLWFLARGGGARIRARLAGMTTAGRTGFLLAVVGGVVPSLSRLYWEGMFLFKATLWDALAALMFRFPLGEGPGNDQLMVMYTLNRATFTFNFIILPVLLIGLALNLARRLPVQER